MSLTAGTRLGPYEIVAPLGAGGMGEVYRARDTRLGRLVAIKVLSATALDDAEEQRRLLHEARAASALNHPNIVTVHDVGTEKGAAFVAMELVDGRPLSDTLAGRALPLFDALKYAIQVADALAAAHAAGIIHRDLKPQNVMVTPQGSVKILDFGIAKTLGPPTGETLTIAQTGAGHIVGTVGYMSPEQAEGRAVDARSDIFSFGSVLYEMLTGQPPFKRDTSMATLAAIVNQEPRPLSAIVETAPPEVERIVAKCLRKDPSRRFQSIADVRVVLEDLRDDLARRSDQASVTAASAQAISAERRYGTIAAALIVGISYDWWSVRVDTGEAAPTGAATAFRAAGVSAAAGAVGLLPAPAAWIANRIIAAAPGSLWSVEMGGPPAHAVKHIQRLTFGPGEVGDPTMSRNGVIAFVAATAAHNIWALPIDAERGTVRGELQQVTNTAGHYGRATSSADGRMLAFQSQRDSRWTILTMDRTSGRVTDLAVSARPGGPVISPDGTKVAYGNSDGASYVVAVRGGAPRKLCDGCGIGDWTSDGRSVVTTTSDRVREAKLVNAETGEATTFLTGNIDRVHLSPDNRWVALRTIDQQRSRVFAAPLKPGTPPSPSEWVPITDREVDVRPCGWSPSGRMFYLVSSRDGFRCLYACPWDPEKGQPRGPVQLVRHIHNIRNLGSGGASVISTGVGNAVMQDQVLLDLATTVSNLWTMQLPASQ